MLSKVVSSTIFKVFGMTRPGIEPRSPGPLANTLTAGPIRTLNRIGQLPELIASAEEHKIDIICIQEHRYTHTEDIKYHETGNGLSLATVSAWKNSVNAAVGGVGLLIGPRALKRLIALRKYNLE